MARTWDEKWKLMYWLSGAVTGDTSNSLFESDRFCKFPQDLELIFYYPVWLKQIEILCHSIKIPKSIEIYSKFNDEEYKKLG